MRQVKNFIKKYLPGSLIGILRWIRGKYIVHLDSVIAPLWYPSNMIKFLIMHKISFHAASDTSNRRIYNYRYELLPNSFLSTQEKKSVGVNCAIPEMKLTIGYPAWNLLYYSLLCSLMDKNNEAIVVETGTNQGYSTIILAQALKDANMKGYVHTVDINGKNINLAKENVFKAGLAEYVKFYNSDAVTFLTEFAKKVKYINFTFIDDLHEYTHIKNEFSAIYLKIVACNGKVYFDNSSGGNVRRALVFIKRAYPGNIVEFYNCSWGVPGNAIWQPF